MSVIDNIRKELKKISEPKKITNSKESFGEVSFAITSIPRIIEKKNTDYVSYGEDNLYPQQLDDLSRRSSIHGAIIKTASDMISGQGFLVDGKSKEESDIIIENDKELKVFLENPYDSMTVDEVKNNLALDLKKHGAYCYEWIWNKEFTKPARIKYIPVRNVRAGKESEGKVKTYYYSKDWANAGKAGNKPKELFVYDLKDKENYSQIVYEKLGSDDYYGEPDYIQGIDWINVDYQMGLFHLSNIENGMNPSLLWRFFKKPATENDQQEIMDDIRKNYKGAAKTGKHIVLFSDGRDNAAEVSPVQTNNLDKQLLLLAELADKKILTAHKLTSPLLAGISISGQLGGNIELEKAYNIYDKSRIEPYRKMISRSFTKRINDCKINHTLQINPFNPFI